MEPQLESIENYDSLGFYVDKNKPSGQMKKCGKLYRTTS